jgi:hypothetical protein
MAEVTVMTQGSTRELRAVLWETIAGIRSGAVKPEQGNAITNTSNAWLRTIKIELDYHKSIGKAPNIPALTSGE